MRCVNKHLLLSIFIRKNLSFYLLIREISVVCVLRKFSKIPMSRSKKNISSVSVYFVCQEQKSQYDTESFVLLANLSGTVLNFIGKIRLICAAIISSQLLQISVTSGVLISSTAIVIWKVGSQCIFLSNPSAWCLLNVLGSQFSYTDTRSPEYVFQEDGDQAANDLKGLSSNRQLQSIMSWRDFCRLEELNRGIFLYVESWKIYCLWWMINQARSITFYFFT